MSISLFHLHWWIFYENTLNEFNRFCLVAQANGSFTQLYPSLISVLNKLCDTILSLINNYPMIEYFENNEITVELVDSLIWTAEPNTSIIYLSLCARSTHNSSHTLNWLMKFIEGWSISTWTWWTKCANLCLCSHKYLVIDRQTHSSAHRLQHINWLHLLCISVRLCDYTGFYSYIIWCSVLFLFKL